jgi:hypothetical protein
VAQTTLLTDDLLRHLMAVGQVDIVVGVPTLNNADTIGGTLKAADEGLARYFPRERTVIINADGGSRDGTPEIVTELASGVGGRRDTSGALRTRHQISTSYRGVPGKAGAVRLIFAAADLLQAGAVAVLDPEVTSVTPAWIATLVGPVWKQSFDLVAPLYGRHPLEGVMLTQLVRPLMRATYGRQVDEPLLGEFGCSGRFAAYCMAQDGWDSTRIRDAIELWLTATACAGDFRVCQTFLGQRAVVPGGQARRTLRDVFPLVVASLFECLDTQAPYWLTKEASEPVPVIGPEGQRTVEPPSLDPARLGDSFCEDVGDLQPVLEAILTPDTLAKIQTMADAGGVKALRYADDVWIATVYDFLAAHHRDVMDRSHIAQALQPLYLGRTASFLLQHAASAETEVDRDLEELGDRFERSKPYLIERWNRTR